MTERAWRTAMIAALATLALPLSAQAEPTFCERLAERIGLRPAPPPAKDVWELQTAGGLKGLLFGGATTTTVAVRTDNPTPAELRRLDRACRAAPGGAICNVEGPAIFGINFKNIDLDLRAGPGEVAVVRVVDTVIRCEGR